MDAPPSYAEAIALTAITPQNFCSRCGHKLEHREKCLSCGYIVVRTYEPLPYPSSSSTDTPVILSVPLNSIDQSTFIHQQPRNSNNTTPNASAAITKQPLPALLPIAPPPQPNVPTPSPGTHTASQTYNNTSTLTQRNRDTRSARNPNDMAVRIGDRLYIDFDKIPSTCFNRAGLHANVKDHMPNELRSRGITPAQWKEWMTELNDDVQKMAPSRAGSICLFCFPGFIVQAILCNLFCPLSYNHPLAKLPCCYGDWFARLRDWQLKVNLVLNRHLMHAKLVTYKAIGNEPSTKLLSQRKEGKDTSRLELSFLVIALTKKESEKLIDEPWNHGFVDNSFAGIGRSL